ncbi:hypothetical protein QAD02_017516 [Eretmocerus hayati]|uniref:Uncharacterized protein n=1 Tax=Eretmocerus hayati TaxID=131215 RepID=A0ACC2PGL1_9HYME|nr:hypothetical protein QAD02_017516 [Eretmocerus hayati]
MPPKRTLEVVTDNNAGPSNKLAKKFVEPALASKGGAKKAQSSKQSKKSDKTKQVDKPFYKPKLVIARPTVPIDPEQQELLNQQLFSAVESASLELIKQLVEKGADVNAEDEDGDPLVFTALNHFSDWTTRSVRHETLELLLSLGANPNCVNAQGQTLLLNAIDSIRGSEDAKLLQVLFEGGADPNLESGDSNDLLPLWEIILSGEEKQVDLFFQYGADVTTLGKDGKSILSFLTELNTDMVPLRDWELERYVIKYTRICKSRGAKLIAADIQTEGYGNPLQKYLQCGEESEARAFVNEYKKGFRGVERPLFVAASNPHMKCLKFLLKSGLFNVNERDYFGCTPLHKAAYCENENNVRLLLEHGADPNATSNHGETPFMIAKREKYHKHMNFLRNYGAKSPERNSDDSDDLNDDYRDLW